jgi:hypothetical protein
MKRRASKQATRKRARTPQVTTPSVPAESVAFVRAQLRELLTSRGGRPGLRHATLRQRVPMRPEDWAVCVEIARQLADEKFAPTPSHVAAVLITARLQEIEVEMLHRRLRELEPREAKTPRDEAPGAPNDTGSFTP